MVAYSCHELKLFRKVLVRINIGLKLVMCLKA